MAKYKFKIDPPEPPEERVKEHQDFGRLRANYDKAKSLHRVPLYKNKKVFLVLVLIALVACLVAEFFEERKKDREHAHGKEVTTPLPPKN
ncbi:MAG TPA: hypothetical protein VGO45_01980 [Bacteroidia bacterium]|jgi:hypothetical protein|nr:hypothetical protein [Bacteroidia bacterium]